MGDRCPPDGYVAPFKRHTVTVFWPQTRAISFGMCTPGRFQSTVPFWEPKQILARNGFANQLRSFGQITQTGGQF
jgi:hypothetical protein